MDLRPNNKTAFGWSFDVNSQLQGVSSQTMMLSQQKNANFIEKFSINGIFLHFEALYKQPFFDEIICNLPYVDKVQ